jgi:hypothetical protein
MILPLRLSSREKNSQSTRTTHKEEFEYIGLCLRELLRFWWDDRKKFFRKGKNAPKDDI